METDPVQNDYQRLLATAALFQETFSIDWLMDLFADKKPSEILSLLANGVGEGVLRQEGPGQYRFSHPRKKDDWKQRLSEQEETIAHGFIADTLMRQLPDDDQKAYALAHHLIHIVNDTERCQYLTAAGDLHLNAFRAEDALQCYTKVLDDLSTRHGEDEDRLFARTAQIIRREDNAITYRGVIGFFHLADLPTVGPAGDVRLPQQVHQRTVIERQRHGRVCIHCKGGHADQVALAAADAEAVPGIASEHEILKYHFHGIHAAHRLAIEDKILLGHASRNIEHHLYRDAFSERRVFTSGLRTRESDDQGGNRKDTQQWNDKAQA